jgi:hypothetical protein
VRSSDTYLLAVHQHERSTPVCAAKLVDIARNVPNVPTTISAFVDAILTGTSVYAISKDSRRLALHCARRITEQAAARRKSVAELLRFQKVEDELARLRLSWWGR